MFYEVQSNLSNFLWSISLIPTEIEIGIRARKYQKDNHCFEKEAEKKNKKYASNKAEEKKQKKMATEAANADKNDDYSDSVKNDIVAMSGEDALKNINLIGRATTTNKLIQYALFYMTDERAKLISHNQIEKEIINGIAALFDFGKIYDSAYVADLKKYDFSYKDDYLQTSKYLLSIKDISKNLSDPVFVEKMNKRKEQLLAESESPRDDEPEKEDQQVKNSYFNLNWVSDDNGLIHPIFFDSQQTEAPMKTEPVVMNPKQGFGISDELFEKLESHFSKLLTNMNYRYEIRNDNSGLITLFITRDSGIEECYTIDPGLVMGLGKFYILANLFNDTLYVPVDENYSDIVEKVLNSAFYRLDANDAQRCLYGYFRNMSLYRYISMQNTENFNNLSFEEFQKLGKKLSFVIHQVHIQSNGSEMPRFRFDKFESVDSFTLISDYNVLSPMCMDNTTSNVIVDGLTFEINNDNVTQKYQGSVVEFHIDKYGEM